MNKKHTLSQRVCNDYAIRGGIFCSVYIVFFPLWLCVLFLLKELMPDLKISEWVAYLPIFLVFGVMVFQSLFLFHKVHLTKEGAILSWCGISLKTIPSDCLQLLCAVGNEYGDNLCLTCHTTDDLALLEEKALLKNYFTKHEVLFLKRKANFREGFAQKYLIRLRKHALPLFRKEKTLFLPMDLVLLQQIRALYPNLPYKNYTECSKEQKGAYWSYKYAPCFRPTWSNYVPELGEDSLVYRSGKKINRTIPLSTIQTIVRIDVFVLQNRYFPHHVPVLFLTNLSIDDMAKQSTLSHMSQSLRAYQYAVDQVKHWDIKANNCCNLHYKEETIARLRSLCPNAQWLDLSDLWFAHAPDPCTVDVEV